MGWASWAQVPQEGEAKEMSAAALDNGTDVQVGPRRFGFQHFGKKCERKKEIGNKTNAFVTLMSSYVLSTCLIEFLNKTSVKEPFGHGCLQKKKGKLALAGLFGLGS